jgi:hypothetical protein
MKQGVEIFTPWSWRVGMWETLHLFSRYNQELYVQATSPNETLVSAYPTINEAADSMTVVLVNRSQTEKLQVSLNMTGFVANKWGIDMYSLSKLTATETFISHTKNALVKSGVQVADQVMVELAPLSVNSILLKAAVTSVRPEMSKGSLQSSLYPNPATEMVHLAFSLPESGPLSIRLFNVNGQLLKTIRQEAFEAGSHLVDMDAETLSKGVYWIQFESSKEMQTIKLIKK